MTLDLNELTVSQVFDGILRNLIRPDGIIPNDRRDFLLFGGIRKNKQFTLFEYVIIFGMIVICLSLENVVIISFILPNLYFIPTSPNDVCVLFCCSSPYLEWKVRSVNSRLCLRTAYIKGICAIPA